MHQDTEKPRMRQPPIPADAGRDQAQTPTPDPDIRIYVACLAAYNNGILHGRWIDATQGEDHLFAETQAMLKTSPIPDAEEWAIHDYEGFEGAQLEEYSSFATVTALAEFIEQHGSFGAHLIAHFGGHLDDAQSAFENYAGEYQSLEDFAAELTEQSGTKIPQQLQNYIDYAAMGRDLELAGDVFTIELGFQQVHIFWAH